MSFASVTIIMACLIIMGSFSLLVLNINAMIDDLEKENEVVVFVDESLSDEQAQVLQSDIESVPNVVNVRFVTREEAMKSFEEDYDKDLFADIDSSVFRNRFVVSLTDISLMQDTKAALEAVDGVAKVNAHLEYAQGFITVRNIVSVVSLVLIVLLIAVSLLIMTNTIKLATFTRREEIAIMKMVGAGNGFIRCPFIVEGLVLGLLGGGLAFLLEWGIYVLVCNRIVTGVTCTLISVIQFNVIVWPMLIAYLTVGVLVGVIGGSTAIRNYLKV
jgi:cell division transport system permease protein